MIIKIDEFDKWTIDSLGDFNEYRFLEHISGDFRRVTRLEVWAKLILKLTTQ